MRFVVGIDPGNTGAVALVAGTLDGRQVVDVWDAPTVFTKAVKGKQRRRAFDHVLAHWIFEKIKAGVEALQARAQPVVVVERQMAFAGPGRSAGPTGMLNLGIQYGAYQQLAACYGWRCEIVGAAVWRPRMVGTGTNKEAALRRCRQLHPNVDYGERGDAGRAEAILIAEWYLEKGDAIASLE